MDFFGLGFWEIVLILIIALIVLGPNKLPDVARTLGKTLRSLRKATSDFTTVLTKEMNTEEKTHPPQPKTETKNKETQPKTEKSE
jgi:sec-independent protein translocase protein TatA